MITSSDPIRKVFTETSANKDSLLYKLLDDAITPHPMEAIFVYDFNADETAFATGWDELLGLTNEHSIGAIFDHIHKKFRIQVLEIIECLISEMLKKPSDLEKYGCTIEFKMKPANGPLLPVVCRISARDISEDGELESCIIRCQRDDSLRIGSTARYTFYGPEEARFMAEVNKKYSIYNQISANELQILRLVAQGKAFKEIADELAVSKSTVEKRVHGMYRRFGVQSIAHLVGHAYDNLLLP